MRPMRSPMSGTLRADGRWQIILTLTAPDGTKKNKCLIRKTQREVQAAAQEYIRSNGHTAIEPHTMAELIQACREGRWQGLDGDTLIQYEWASRRILEHFKKVKDVRTITAPMVATWLAKLRSDEDLKSGRSVQIHRSVFRVAMKYGFELGWTEGTAVWDVRLGVSPKPRDRRRLTLLEAQAIIEAEPNEERKKFWWTLLESGLRPNEATRLQQPESVLYSQDTWWIQVRKSKTEAGTDRIVMIGDALGAALHNQEDGPCFPSIRFETGGDRKTVSKYWKRACENGSVPHTNLYQLRKLRVQLWRSAGVPDDVVVKMVGHTNIELTKSVYDDVTRERIKRSFEGKF